MVLQENQLLEDLSWTVQVAPFPVQIAFGAFAEKVNVPTPVGAVPVMS